MGVYREVRPGVFSVGVIDWDRRLFDELIPLPDGTSYNAYVIRGGDKTALIDAADPPFAEELLDNIEALGLDRLDYVVANHAEQDHSGAIPKVLERYSDALVVCTPGAGSFWRATSRSRPRSLRPSRMERLYPSAERPWSFSTPLGPLARDDGHVPPGR